MAEKYTADYSLLRECWCVFERITASIRVVCHVCPDKAAAEKLAEKLNSEEGNAE
jgi:hypothetical protein